MLKGKAHVQETDMPTRMQNEAMAFASEALDIYDVTDFASIAAHIKKEFDKIYGSGWQCVVGSSFGGFFTHSKGTFVYFALETLNFLIFKGASS
ncbi:OLC1v1037324C1 [Oldenlandia corymbosa var. corymbosa]|uniref:Dynein light chain n=1 Tax=Oldenlandia corymbosa var. corymbosa TaxID=529605 RepID=A0AAV1D163_OLDCO|nr:OLC1v1037324C1 [Oldenlandia corymbosa var. corymbosa]